MGGDYTRFTFRPENDYASVLRQQGRVALDADHNEFAEILDRRLRAETLDILGQCTVPRQPLDPADGLPTSFRIYASATGVAIGRGRAYVDGMLAECRGDPQSAEVFDAALGEIVYGSALPWTAQPSYPQPPDLTPPVADRVDLLYLDVWEREITAIEDPRIREVALGGPDTTTRRQTLWQVKVLEDVGVQTCADAAELQAWAELTATSGGRLTTSYDQAFVPDDEPCTIAPAGGYRGLENRLYRVEIHRTGPIAPDAASVDAGTARYKWSRDNASLVSAVERIENVPASGTDPARTLVRLRVLGRDQVLRFAHDDWVEVLDDYTEFRQDSGQMSRVTAIDEANRIITLVPQLDLSPDVLDPGVENPDGTNPTLQARHTRVRRWGRDALRPAIAGPVPLDDGIRITLTLDGGSFHNGDYWVFAARTSTGTIDLLDAARPRGILHHFGRLALIDWTSTPTQPQVIDCRTHWPPRGGVGCCTVIVTPGDDVQQAIDALPPEGGCVCLKTGVHQVSATVRIDRSHVCIEGESPGTIVRHTTTGPVFRIAGAGQAPIERVCISCVRFEVADAGMPPIVEIDGLMDGMIEKCAWSAANERDTTSTIGLHIANGRRIIVRHGTFRLVAAPLVIAASEGIEILENVLLGPTMEGPAGELLTAGTVGVSLEDDCRGPCHISGNLIREFLSPIAIGAGAGHSTIHDNHIERANGVPADAIPPAPSGSALGSRLFAIDCRAPACDIARNAIVLTRFVHGGIRAAAPLIHVTANRIHSETEQPNLEAPLTRTPMGIYVDDQMRRGTAGDCSVCANELTGLQNAISVGDTRADIHGVAITHNRIAGAVKIVSELARPFLDPETPVALHVAPGPSADLYAIRLDGVITGTVSHNEIRHVPTGILLSSAERVRVHHNSVSTGVLGVALIAAHETDVDRNALEALALASSLIIRCARVRVLANRLDGDGWFGVLVRWASDATVRGNLVGGRRVGVALTEVVRPRVEHDTVEHASNVGILAFQCLDSVVLAHNEVRECGSAGLSPFLLDPDPPTPEPQIAVGILVHDTTGAVALESNRVIGTGHSSARNEAFPGLVFDVSIMIFAECRVHANVIEGAPDRPGDGADSITLVTYAPGGETVPVEVSDNAIATTGVSACWALGVRHIVFANNRIRQNVRLQFSIANLVQANSLSIVANRVASPPNIFAFGVIAPHLSPMANVTTQPWLVSTPPAGIIPSPLASFNILGV